MTFAPIHPVSSHSLAKPPNPTHAILRLTDASKLVFVTYQCILPILEHLTHIPEHHLESYPDSFPVYFAPCINASVFETYILAYLRAFLQRTEGLQGAQLSNAQTETQNAFFILLMKLPIHILNKIRLEALHFELGRLVELVTMALKHAHQRSVRAAVDSTREDEEDSKKSPTAQQHQSFPHESLLRFAYTNTIDASMVTKRRFTHPMAPSDTFILGTIGSVRLIPRDLYRFRLYIGGCMGHFALALHHKSSNAVQFVQLPSIGMQINTREPVLFEVGIKEIQEQKTAVVETVYELQSPSDTSTPSASMYTVYILWKKYDENVPMTTVDAPVIFQVYRIHHSSESFSEDDLLKQFHHRSTISIANNIHTDARAHDSHIDPRQSSSTLPTMSHGTLCIPLHYLLTDSQYKMLTAYQKLVLAANNFTQNLYVQLAQSLGDSVTVYRENIVLSALSAQIILSLLMGGATGKTLQEMSSVLAPTLTSEVSFPAVVHGMERDLLLALHHSGDTMEITNTVFIDTEFKLLVDFVKTARECYNAEIKPVAFKDAPQDARTDINQHVAHCTKGLIPELLSDPSSIQSDTRLVLVNTIYLKGVFKHAFDPQNTRRKAFHLFGSSVTDSFVQMMTATKVTRQYGKHKWDISGQTVEFKSLKLPFQGASTLLVLLPRHNTLQHICILEQMIFQVGLSVLQRMENEQSMTTLDTIEIPKFKISFSGNLKPLLQNMGMQEAFHVQNADFSQCYNRREELSRSGLNLYISQVIQKATLEINETGAEASAATAVIASFGMAAPRVVERKEFIANRPFVCAILTKDPNCPFPVVDFVARILNPSTQ